MLEPLAPVTLYDVEGAPLDRDAIEVRAAEERFDGARLREGTRTYQFVVQGNPMGTMTASLVRDGDVWVMTSSMESPVVSQRSEVRFSAVDMTPVSSTMEMRQGPMTIETDLRYVDGRIIGRLERPEQLGGPLDVDTGVPDGTLLPGMDEYVIAAAELAEGRSLTLPVFDAISGAVTSVTFKVVGTESVTVPAGTFPVYRVDMAGGAGALSMLVRQEAPHILVRQEFPGAPIQIQLQSID